MFNMPLYKREMIGSWKLLLIFMAILSMYVSIMIGMYDPESIKNLEEFAKTMPEIMSAVGMTGGATTLIGFMISYLYGMILIVFPMIFTIIRANGLVAKYTDRGSMVSLVAAPVKRRTVAFTQMKVLATGIFFVIAFITLLQIACSSLYSDELVIGDLMILNLGLLCLHFFIGGVCFLASCLFSEGKYSIGFGAGVPTVMFILQMLANANKDAENVKYLSFFTLFNPSGIVAGETGAILGMIALFAGSLALFAAAITVFSKKDLHI